jgi:hypothetical protein
MLKTSIFAVLFLFNTVAIFCAFNPWILDWQAQGITVLLFEAAFSILIALPVLLYQVIRHKKSFKQSFSDSVKAVMAFASHL